jgi:hypothetical protein
VGRPLIIKASVASDLPLAACGVVFARCPAAGSSERRQSRAPRTAPLH